MSSRQLSQHHTECACHVSIHSIATAIAVFSPAIVSVLLCVNTLTYDFGQYPKHCKMHILDLALADCLLRQEVVCQQSYIHLMSTILAILTKKHLCGCFFSKTHIFLTQILYLCIVVECQGDFPMCHPWFTYIVASIKI